MNKDKLDQLWGGQENDPGSINPNDIIKKARKQRQGQYITITVLVLTVLILLAYAMYFVNQWNNFTLGLTMMISSLVFRVTLEILSLYRKEGQLVSLDSRSFREYLKKHYKVRLRINYFITPICFAIYVIGFILLLPYFKQEFSEGFYTYLLISGIISLLVIMGIIINSILKESRFLKQLNK